MEHHPADPLCESERAGGGAGDGQGGQDLGKGRDTTVADGPGSLLGLTLAPPSVSLWWPLSTSVTHTPALAGHPGRASRAPPLFCSVSLLSLSLFSRSIQFNYRGRHGNKSVRLIDVGIKEERIVYGQ